MVLTGFLSHRVLGPEVDDRKTTRLSDENGAPNLVRAFLVLGKIRGRGDEIEGREGR